MGIVQREADVFGRVFFLFAQATLGANDTLDLREINRTLLPTDDEFNSLLNGIFNFSVPPPPLLSLG